MKSFTYIAMSCNRRDAGAEQKFKDISNAYEVVLYETLCRREGCLQLVYVLTMLLAVQTDFLNSFI